MPDSNAICKGLKNELKLNEQLYFTVCVRSFAQAKEWNDVNTYIQMKKPPCPLAAIGELCDEFKNKELATEAFRRVDDKELRIELLIDFEYWKEAIVQIFACKKQDIYLEDVQAKCPPYARDYIRQEMDKLALK